MKKIFILFYLILILVSCQSENNQETNKFLIGDFGDYAYYEDASKETEKLEEKINLLTKEKVNKINAIYESKYEQGLLDFFDIKNEIHITINISEDELKKMNDDHLKNNKETYRICNLDIKMNGIIFHYENVGIRQKGNTSRGEILNEDNTINLRHYKLSFSEEFDDDYRNDNFQFSSEEHEEYQKDRTFFGMEKFNIRWNRNKDATYLKEYYANEMYRGNGVLAARSNLSKVMMNIDGEVNNLGIYLAVEDIGKEFIKRNLSKDYRSGDLYKLGWSNVGARLDMLDEHLFGVEEQVKNGKKYYQIVYPYDLKTNKKTSKHEQIKSFISNVVYTSVDEYYNFFKRDTYYESLINYLAVSYLLGDPDDLRGNYNNSFIYFINDINQLIIIPTDNDRSLGSTGGTGNPTEHHGAYNKPFDSHTGYSNNDSIFFKNSIFENGNEQIKSDYIDAIKNIISSGWMSSSKFQTYYNIAKNNYKDDLILGDQVQGKKILFNIVESNDVKDGGNLSISTYLELKVKTFNNFISNYK